MGLRFVVIGAGSVGGVISALLQKAGHGVTVIARGAYLDAIRHNGLVLETPRGNRRAPAAGSGASGRCPPEQVTRSPARQGWRRSSWGSVELSEELRLGDAPGPSLSRASRSPSTASCPQMASTALPRLTKSFRYFQRNLRENRDRRPRPPGAGNPRRGSRAPALRPGVRRHRCLLRAVRGRPLGLRQHHPGGLPPPSWEAVRLRGSGPDPARREPQGLRADGRTQGLVCLRGGDRGRDDDWRSYRVCPPRGPPALCRHARAGATAGG